MASPSTDEILKSLLSGWFEQNKANTELLTKIQIELAANTRLGSQTSDDVRELTGKIDGIGPRLNTVEHNLNDVMTAIRGDGFKQTGIVSRLETVESSILKPDEIKTLKTAAETVFKRETERALIIAMLGSGWIGIIYNFAHAHGWIG